MLVSSDFGIGNVGSDLRAPAAKRRALWMSVGIGWWVVLLLCSLDMGYKWPCTIILITSIRNLMHRK